MSRKRKRNRGNPHFPTEDLWPDPDIGDAFTPAQSDAAESAFGILGDHETAAEVRASFREKLETEVNELIDPIAHLDAFEVLTVMHGRERPRQNHRDPEYRPAPLSLEILAAALLARASREPVRTDKREPLSKPVVESLHLRAERIGLLTQIRQIVETRLGSDPLSELGGQYQSRLLEVRNTRYWSIARELDSELFAEPEMSDLLVRNLGFDLAQLRGVDDALLDLGANNRVFTSREIVAHTGLPAESVAAALGAYSQAFGQRAPGTAAPGAGARVFQVLARDNPFLLRPLVADGQGNYLPVVYDASLASPHLLLESILDTDSPDYAQYCLARDAACRNSVIRRLEHVLTMPPALRDFDYYAPRIGQDIDALASTCENPDDVGELKHGDALFAGGGFAIGVEVRGEPMVTKARRGIVRKLSADLRAPMGIAADSAAVLRDLVKANRGLWLAGGQWIEVGEVKSARAILAVLDDVGILGGALTELHRAGVLKADPPAWIVSVHDLAAIGRLCGRPAEFVAYLQRRMSPAVAAAHSGTDELCQYVFFLDGNLVAKVDESALEDQARAAYEALERWIGMPASGREPAEPILKVDPMVIAMVDLMTKLKTTDWLVASAQLIDLDPATRAPLMAEFEKTVAEALALWRSETCTDSAAGGAALPPIERGEVQSPSEPASRSE